MQTLDFLICVNRTKPDSFLFHCWLGQLPHVRKLEQGWSHWVRGDRVFYCQCSCRDRNSSFGRSWSRTIDPLKEKSWQTFQQLRRGETFESMHPIVQVVSCWHLLRSMSKGGRETNSKDSRGFIVICTVRKTVSLLYEIAVPSEWHKD